MEPSKNQANDLIILPARCEKARRKDYYVGSPAETFVVPILRNRITRLIDEYCGHMPQPIHVLDVGCGRQPFRNRIEAFGCVYTGFDVQQTLEGAVDFLGCLDAPLPIGLRDGPRFDFLLCTEVLEHVCDWNIAFTNLAALAKPSARLVITCPFFYMLHEEPYDFWRPTVHALERYAAISGFRLVSSEAAGDCWDVLGTLLASCSASPRRPGLLGRLGSKIINGCRRIMFWLLKWRWLQQMAELRGGLYACNVFVLEKI